MKVSEVTRQEALASWDLPLRCFAAATGLVVSMRDRDGRRRLGPFTTTRVGMQLVSSGAFDGGAPADTFERALCERHDADGDVAPPFDQLRVRAFPLRRGGELAGTVVVGWVFADFPDQLQCERASRLTGLDARRLWHAARLDGPVGARRFRTHGELLRTIVDSGLELRDAIAELERLAQARELFLAHVSHELRTPLHAIGLRLELLLGRPLDDVEVVRASLLAIKKSVQEQSRLVNDLVEASVTRTGRFTLNRSLADLGAIVRAAGDAIRPSAAHKGVELRFTAAYVAPDLPVLADAFRLQQAIWNILSNAVKFTPRGGHVEVTTSTCDDHTYCIEVADDGPGIAPEIASDIFEPFIRRSRDNAPGLGLGLSIARQIVELHGGSIRVKAAVAGSGTTFGITLPAADVGKFAAGTSIH